MFLYSYIYNDNKNIYKFIKKTVNEKKKKCLSLNTPTKKPTFTCWTKFKIAKF